MPAPRHKRLFACALLAACAAVLAATAGARPVKQTPGTWCGGRLWRLMTLSDPQRKAVDLHGAPTTIAAISKLHAPEPTPQSRRTTFQRQVWRMRIVIDRYRIASNGEIVFTLYSIDSAQYMNAYLPNPRCLGPKARDRTGMIAARKEFTSHCPTVRPAWGDPIGITVDIAGVGFWNPSTATRGALQNGAELRPLTNLKIVSGCGIDS